MTNYPFFQWQNFLEIHPFTCIKAIRSIFLSKTGRMRILDKTSCSRFSLLWWYHKIPKFSDTQNIWSNPPKFEHVSKRCRWNGKQCSPWSDCSFRSSLIWVCTVCSDLSVRNLRMILTICLRAATSSQSRALNHLCFFTSSAPFYKYTKMSHIMRKLVFGCTWPGKTQSSLISYKS